MSAANSKDRQRALVAEAQRQRPVIPQPRRDDEYLDQVAERRWVVGFVALLVGISLTTYFLILWAEA